MTLFEIIFLAIALGVDCLIVSFSQGLLIRFKRTKISTILASIMGFFQGGMPLITYLLTGLVYNYIAPFAKLLVFAIFMFLGGKFIVEALKKGELLTDRLCYLTRGTGGKLLKSSTIFIRDFSGNFHYVLSINLDITGFAAFNNSLKSLLSTDDEEQPEATATITNSVNELLDNLIAQSIELIGKAPALMTKDEKVKAIHFLNDAGAFLITKSGEKVAQSFGISKFTLYSYIDINKKPDEKTKGQA